MIISFNIDLENSYRELFWWKKILANSDAEKKKFYSEEIAQVPPLKLNGPSPMRMEAHDLAKLEIDLIHCQSNDSRPMYREQYTIAIPSPIVENCE